MPNLISINKNCRGIFRRLPKTRKNINLNVNDMTLIQKWQNKALKKGKQRASNPIDEGVSFASP